MRRREFIMLLGSMTASWPLATRAPGDEKKRSIAVLAAADHSYDRAFRNRLAELGWQEGRNVQIEFRSAKSDINRARSLADELAKMRPDIFFQQYSDGTIDQRQGPRHPNRVRFCP